MSYRQEGTIDGVNFTFDEWGVGFVRGDSFEWRLSCEIDPLTDSLSCLLTPGWFLVGRGSGGYRVSFGGAKVPGSSIEVRVDGLAVRSASERTGFIGKDADALLAELAKGDRALLRLRGGAYGNEDTREMSLRGFAAGFELLDRVFRSVEEQRSRAPNGKRF